MNEHGAPESPDESALLSKRDDRGEALLSQGDWYEFRVKGHLAACWSEWLDGLAIANQEGGECLLTGLVADQAALHGLLAKIRDLNLPLISVNRTGPGRSDLSRTGDAEENPRP